MTFRKIDRTVWPRNEVFEHYFSNVPCTYSLTTKLDVTNVQAKKIRFYPTMLHAITTVVNQHEEFRTAFNEAGELGIFSCKIHKKTYGIPKFSYGCFFEGTFGITPLRKLASMLR